MNRRMLALLSLLPLAAAADETFRCGNSIVTSAMPVSELTSKCGKPTSRESSTQDVLVRNRNNGLMIKAGKTRVETWIYDRGTRAFSMVVVIVDGRIKSIDRLQ